MQGLDLSEHSESAYGFALEGGSGLESVGGHVAIQASALLAHRENVA